MGRANMEDGWKDPHNGGTYSMNSKSTDDMLVVDHYGGNFPHFHDRVDMVFESDRRRVEMEHTKHKKVKGSSGCRVYGCSNSQGVSAADSSANYCNIRNLYANEKDDKVPPVKTNLNYKEVSKSSQLGPMDLQKKMCNSLKTEKKKKLVTLAE